jgi:hypothetical protein
MSVGFSLYITPARVSKDQSYQDAFANIPCECCEQIQAVYEVRATYNDTVLLRAYVPAHSVTGACGQAIELAEILGPRIDAAEAAYERERGGAIDEFEAGSAAEAEGGME